MNIALIPPDHVLRMWPRVRPFMQKAAEYTHGRYEVDDILVSITDYGNDLWVVFDDSINVLFGACVTGFKHYPRMKCLDMIFIGGDDNTGMGWKNDMLKVLQHWAYDNHCDEIESSGRPGWAKIFKSDGYTMLWQTFALPVADCGLQEAA
jgi:hypothetical protein